MSILDIPELPDIRKQTTGGALEIPELPDIAPQSKRVQEGPTTPWKKSYSCVGCGDYAKDYLKIVYGATVPSLHGLPRVKGQYQEGDAIFLQPRKGDSNTTRHWGIVEPGGKTYTSWVSVDGKPIGVRSTPIASVMDRSPVFYRPPIKTKNAKPVAVTTPPNYDPIFYGKKLNQLAADRNVSGAEAAQSLRTGLQKDGFKGDELEREHARLMNAYFWGNHGRPKAGSYNKPSKPLPAVVQRGVNAIKPVAKYAGNLQMSSTEAAKNLSEAAVEFPVQIVSTALTGRQIPNALSYIRTGEATAPVVPEAEWNARIADSHDRIAAWLGEKHRDKVGAVLGYINDMALASSRPMKASDIKDLAEFVWGSVTSAPEQLKTGNIQPLLEAAAIIAGGYHGIKAGVRGVRGKLAPKPKPLVLTPEDLANVEVPGKPRIDIDRAIAELEAREPKPVGPGTEAVAPVALADRVRTEIERAYQAPKEPKPKSKPMAATADVPPPTLDEYIAGMTKPGETLTKAQTDALTARWQEKWGKTEAVPIQSKPPVQQLAEKPVVGERVNDIPYVRHRERFIEIPTDAKPKEIKLPSHEEQDFIVHKKLDSEGRPTKEWRVTEGRSGLFVAEGKTIEEAVTNAKARIDKFGKLEESIQAAIDESGISPRWGGKVEAGLVESTIDRTIRENREIRAKYGEEFQHIFGTRLESLLRNLYGFDLVEFAQRVFPKLPDNVPLAEAVRAKYGEAGEAVIQKILDYRSRPLREEIPVKPKPVPAETPKPPKPAKSPKIDALDAELQAIRERRAKRLAAEEAALPETLKKAKKGKQGGFAAQLSKDDLVDALDMARVHIKKGVATVEELAIRLKEDFGDAILPHVKRLWDEAGAKGIVRTRTKVGASKAALAEQKAGRGAGELEVHATRSIESAIERGKRDVIEGNVERTTLRQKGLAGDYVYSDREVGGMLYDNMSLRNERNRLLDDTAITAENDAVAWSAKMERIQELDRLIGENELAMDRGGTEAGRALNALKAGMKDDFSFEMLEKRMRVAKGNKPLSAEEIRALRQRVATLEAANRTLAEVQGKEGGRQSATKPRQYRITEEAYELAKKRFAEKLSRIHAGPDILDILPDLVEMMAYWIERGTYKSYDAMRTALKKDHPTLSDDIIEEAHRRATREAKEKAYSEETAAQGKRLLTDKPIPRKAPRYEPTEELLQARMNVRAARKAITELVEPPNRKAAMRVLTQRLKDRGKTRTEQMMNELLSVDENDLKGQWNIIKKHAPPTVGEKVANIGYEVLGLHRALMTAYDISAGGRQGGKLLFRNPVIWGRAFVGQFKVMRNPKAFEAQLARMEADPDFDLAVDSGLSITKPSTQFGGKFREEAYQGGTWAEKIPGISGSERAYTYFLDYLRFNVFKKFKSVLEFQGKDTPKNLKDLATVINTMTGRGTLGKLEAVAPELTTLLFSPRNLSGHIKTPFMMLNPKFSPEVRKIAAQNYGAYVAGTVGLIAVTKLAMGNKASVNPNPLSTDFGKVRMGNQRIDLSAGDLTLFRTFCRFLTGHTLDSSGRYKRLKFGDIKTGFERSKLSPTIGLLWTLYDGTDFTGENISEAYRNKPFRRFINDFGLMIVNDMLDGYEGEGLRGAALAGALSLVGKSVQTYSDKPKKARGKKPKPLIPRPVTPKVSIPTARSIIEEARRQ